ncbi:MAG TPA: EthD domain-containing protein [Acidimicrobiales bacterium]|nr:EthD domain-containing protein [Acidimicrobiales bacterium]
MIDVVLCARRRDDMSVEEFHRYWRDEHAPLVASHAETLGMLSYVLHLTLNTGLESIVQEDRGCPADVYDGVAVLCFESLDEMAAKGAEPAALAAAEELAADERRFIDHAQSRIWFTEHHTII